MPDSFPPRPHRVVDVPHVAEGATYATPGAACAGVEDASHAWLDGELAPPAAAGFAAHLRACPRCDRHVAELAGFLAAVRQSVRPVRAPATLRALVRALAAGGWPGARG